MADVAELGLRVDSSQVKAGADQLRNFEAVARRTGETVDQVQKRFNALNPATSAAADNTKALTAAAAPANEQIVRMGAAADRTNVTMNRLFGFTIATVAGAATRALVRYAMDLNKTLADTADTAERAGISYQRFQGLAAAGQNKGINDKDFNAGILKFNEQVDLARNGLGSLGSLLRANGKQVTDTATTFGVVADLVRNAGSEAQKFSILQQAGLPASREFVKLMEQGATKINEQADAAKKLSDQQLEQAKKIDAAWNEMWANFEREGKKAIVEIFDSNNWQISIVPGSPADKFIQFLKGLKGGVPQVNQPDFIANNGSPTPLVTRGADLPAPAAPRRTVDPELLKQQLSLEQQRIGILGQTASALDQVRAVEIQIQTARLNGVTITKAQADNLKRLAQEQALGISQIKASTDAYNVEAATIGMSTEKAVSYAAAQSAINDAKRKGMPLTQDNIAAIQREADALGKAAQRSSDLKFAYDTTQSFFQTFGQGIRNGANEWESFKNAGVNALGTIADKLMKMAVDNLWTSAFGGAGGIGGIIGKLFGFSGGGFVGDYGQSSNATGLGAGTGGLSFPTFASGGYTGAGGKYQPAGIVHAGEFVFSQQAVNRIGVGTLNRIHRGYADGGFVDNVIPMGRGQDNSPQMVFTFAPNVDARGADAQAVARLELAMARQQRDFEKNVQGVMAKYRANTPGSNR